MKLVTIIGARPQFIKAAAVSRAIVKHNLNYSNDIKEIIIHTGQHYDHNMSSVFFKQLELQKPNYNLEIAGLSHGAMTGRMLEDIERILIKESPQYVLLYGDTNSTLAGALAASKMHIPVAHVEAGLRSYNMSMPEEINRLLTDNVSTLLFCPTSTAVANLKKEGITKGVHQVGDVMYDVALHYKEKAQKSCDIADWNLIDKEFILCTIHRAENTDNLLRLESIFMALKQMQQSFKVVLPMHPRTKKTIINARKEDWLKGLIILDPLPYLELMRLEISAKMILTDSGGIQKEAFFHKVPCLTLRDETEWVETVQLGWNKVVGVDLENIMKAFNQADNNTNFTNEYPYGKGETSLDIINILSNS